MAQNEIEDLIKTIAAEKGTYDLVIAEHFKVIKEGDLERIAAKEHYDRLLPLLEVLDLDDSLKAAAPSVCQRKTTERGVFDLMILDQVERCLITKVHELSGKISAEEANASKSRQAAAQANALCEKLQVDQARLSMDLTNAMQAQKDAIASLDAATSDLKTFDVESSRAIELRDAAQTAFENFRNYNISCYEVLKAKSNVKAIAFSDSMGSEVQ